MKRNPWSVWTICLLLSACSLAPGATPESTINASTLAAQTWEVMQAKQGTVQVEAITGAPEGKPADPVQESGVATLPKAATATPRYTLEPLVPSATYAPALDLESIILTGAPTVLPLLTQILGDPIQLDVEPSTPQPGGIYEVAPEIGSVAPDFMLVDARTGERVQLSKLEGKPVLINFWATWCTYCVQEMPTIQKAYEKYQPQELVVLALDVQETRDKAANFGKKLGLSYNLLLDNEGAVASMYRVTTMPTSFFVARDGVIHSIAVGAMDTEALDWHLATILE